MRRDEKSAAWECRITDRLLELKHMGFRFDRAWQVAISEHPARMRDRAPAATNLFEMAEAEETMEVFMERCCRDAWYGRKPALARLQSMLVDGEVFADVEGIHGRQKRLMAPAA